MQRQKVSRLLRSRLPQAWRGVKAKWGVFEAHSFVFVNKHVFHVFRAGQHVMLGQRRVS